MKELFKIISCPVYVIICMLCFSCSDSSDDILNPDSSDDKVVEEVLNKASISWNSSVEHIKKQMKGYTLVDSDVDFLKFTDKNGVLTISYSFTNDSLKATAAVAPKISEIDLSSYLQGYAELGGLSTKQVLYNTSKNTMCFSYDSTIDDTEYTIIGFTPINSSLYANVEPIIVSTIEATNIKTTSATIKGAISGVSKTYTCGVRYSTDKTFATSKTKTTKSRGEFSLSISSLTKNATYYFKCYSIVDGVTYEGEVMEFKTL